MSQGKYDGKNEMLNEILKKKTTLINKWRRLYLLVCLIII